MTVRRHATKKFKHLNMPISYRVLDDDNFLADARNVFDNKNVCETRYGVKRYTTSSLSGSILSISYFKTSAGSRFKIVKVGGTLYSYEGSASSTVLASGLTTATRHRAVTFNGRHIITIEGDGIFTFDGTTFSTLGQGPPTTGVAAVAVGGSLTATTNYQVAYTFYATGTGFESNIYESAVVTTTAPNKLINLTSIQTYSTNTTINKIRIYLKNVDTNSAYLRVVEADLGTASYQITANSTSTLIPPTKNAAPISGGGKYPTLFGKKFAYAGNSSFQSEVFLSEEYLPDAFNGLASSQIVLQLSGDGPITGIATGLYNDATLTPFLVIFKKNRVAIYSEVGGIANLATLDPNVGCISHDTIRIRNGGVYFMGENGWYGIVNGLLLQDSKGHQASLGDGAIDDIFSRVGWSNLLNIPLANTFFSSYYSTDSQYITFVCEGSSSACTKAYVYELSTNGFKVFSFKSTFVCMTEGEDDLGNQVLFIGDNTGIIFTYSAVNARHDEDNAGASQTIPAYAILPYLKPGEDANTYNYRTLTVRALASTNLITVRSYTNFSLISYNTNSYNFTNPESGFTLDVSQLDVGILGDERAPVTAIADLNVTGETLRVGFYQDILDANMAIISAQISLNKNGNNNR